MKRFFIVMVLVLASLNANAYWRGGAGRNIGVPAHPSIAPSTVIRTQGVVGGGYYAPRGYARGAYGAVAYGMMPAAYGAVVYAPEPVMYDAPPVVYEQPVPAYYQPAPRYYRPAPKYYRPATYAAPANVMTVNINRRGNAVNVIVDGVAIGVGYGR